VSGQALLTMISHVVPARHDCRVLLRPVRRRRGRATQLVAGAGRMLRADRDAWRAAACALYVRCRLVGIYCIGIGCDARCRRSVVGPRKVHASLLTGFYTTLYLYLSANPCRRRRRLRRRATRALPRSERASGKASGMGQARASAMRSAPRAIGSAPQGA